MIPSTMDAKAAMDAKATEEVRRKLGLDNVRRNLKPGEDQDKKLREATEGFESMFIQRLWQQMRKSVPKEGYLHSKEEDAYLSMFDEELSKKMSRAGGIGLGDMLYKELREQLVRSSGDTATRGGGPADLKPLNPDPMSLDRAGGPLKALDEVNTAKNADVSGLVTPARKYETAKAADTRIEPKFNPLDDVSPAPRDAAAVPLEIMHKVNNLAARIELESSRAAAAAPNTPVESKDGPGAMHWPVQGDVASGYGWRTDKVTGAHEWHSGLDVSGAEGDPVESCWDGKVIFAGQRGRFGNLVVVEHAGGWRSYYGHNKVNLVSEGDTVTAGSKIAELGSTGRATEPTLHFEVRQGDRAENPSQVMERLQAGLSRTSE